MWVFEPCWSDFVQYIDFMFSVLKTLLRIADVGHTQGRKSQTPAEGLQLKKSNLEKL